MIARELISAILQILAFSLIPFLVYISKRKTAKGFFNYIGLSATTRQANLLAVGASLVFIAAALVIIFLSENMKQLLTSPPAIQGQLRQMGLTIESVMVLLIIAWLKTSLSEEILFRGFIAKRLIAALGFSKGNFLQAFIFALVHVLLFWLLTKADLVFIVFIFLLSGLAGYLVGYIKEKKGKGSIIPGWIAHGLGNTISYYIIAFVI